MELMTRWSSCQAVRGRQALKVRGVPANPPSAARAATSGVNVPEATSVALEAADLCVRLHDDLPGLHSVGWDVAFTPDGPIVIEGNDNWNGSHSNGAGPEFQAGVRSALYRTIGVYSAARILARFPAARRPFGKTAARLSGETTTLATAAAATLTARQNRV